jgi:tetratricopeptide (TPR) repeat protein
MKVDDMGDSFTDRLSEYLDDEDMSATERASIDAHLATCASCRTTLTELRAVQAKALSLPDQPPTTDLWSGIAPRLDPPSTVRPFVKRERRFSFTLPQLVAAGLALMVVSGGMVWLMQLGGSRTSIPQVIATVQAPSSEAAQSSSKSEDEPAPTTIQRVNFGDAHYDEAIADLEKTLASNRSRLNADTVRILEENLMAIDQAIDQCRKALRNDPSNVYLNNHFVESRNRKLTLLRRAAALAMDEATSGS